jgi:hypothetical protein
MSFALHYCQEFQLYGAPVSLETGPRVSTQDLPLVVTTASVALDFNSRGHGRRSGVGTLDWRFVFWIGDQSQVS